MARQPREIAGCMRDGVGKIGGTESVEVSSVVFCVSLFLLKLRNLSNKTFQMRDGWRFLFFFFCDHQFRYIMYENKLFLSIM